MSRPSQKLLGNTRWQRCHTCKHEAQIHDGKRHPYYCAEDKCECKKYVGKSYPIDKNEPYFKKEYK